MGNTMDQIDSFLYAHTWHLQSVDQTRTIFGDVDSVKVVLEGNLKANHVFRPRYRYNWDSLNAEINQVLNGKAPYGNLAIKKVIFNDPATIVYWKDGTKTVVKAGADEYFDKEKGLAMAISKKVLGNKGNYYNTFKKHGAIDDSGEVFIPLSLLKECTTLKKMKELIALMEG